MAITFVNRVFAGVTKSAVVLRGTAGTEEILLREHLQTVDETFLNQASLSSGSTLYVKMQATTLPNGLNAAEFFQPRIINTVVEQAAAERRKVSVDQVAAITDLEARVTVLESA